MKHAKPPSRLRRILAKPWEANPRDHLKHILTNLRTAARDHTYCNLSPADCDLLMGSIQATADALASAACVVRQIAREDYGKEAETMTVQEFANRQGYDS